MRILFISAFLTLFLYAGQDLVYEQIEVTYAKPIYQEVAIDIPRQSCEDVKVALTNSEDLNSVGIDTLIGATAGVVIGNQIGKGSGRDAARIIGGIIGAATANKIRTPQQPKRYKIQTQCKQAYEKHYENRLVGYENYFYLNGKEHMKFSKQKLESVRVKLSYSY